MLEIRNLSKRYDEVIINNLSITFPSTGIVVIVGESGCGKTTLLNILGGIDQDYEGEILFDQQNIRTIKHYCRKHVGFIFQNFNLINWLNVKHNFLLPKFFTQIIFKREVEDRQQKLELTNLAKKKPSILSGGQKQRVAMLRSMIKNVDLLLCDEPTGSLDQDSARMIFDLLKQESKERLIIVITHDEQLAYEYADRIYSFQDGKLMGKYRRLKNDSFYCRLKDKKSPLNLYKLALLQYRANFIRNMKITMGIMMALICIMVTFTLSGSLQNQIQKQLNNIFPNQLISMQSRNKQLFSFDDLEALKKNADIIYSYGEMKDYEFMGVSLQSTYNVDKTIYVSDMTKTLKTDKLELGKSIKNDNEIILSKTTAVHLNKDYQELLNQVVYGFYLCGNEIKSIALKVVGISNENTVFDTVYINEFANIKHVSDIYNVAIEDIKFSLGMINIDNRVRTDKCIKQLKKDYQNLEFKIAGEDISGKVGDFILQVERVLLLFSSLAIVAACFLIGEVLYLSVVEKTKDIGIFRCLGASKVQIKLLVLLESFTLISMAYIFSYLFFYQLVMMINKVIETGINISLSESFIQIDYHLLMVIYLGTLVFGIISSYFPARYASCLDPVKSLQFQRY